MSRSFFELYQYSLLLESACCQDFCQIEPCQELKDIIKEVLKEKLEIKTENRTIKNIIQEVSEDKNEEILPVNGDEIKHNETKIVQKTTSWSLKSGVVKTDYKTVKDVRESKSKKVIKNEVGVQKPLNSHNFQARVPKCVVNIFIECHCYCTQRFYVCCKVSKFTTPLASILVKTS